MDYGYSLFFPHIKENINEEISDIIKDMDKRDIPFIVVYGYDPSVHGEMEEALLDKVSSKPLIVFRVDLHSLYMNRYAMDYIFKVSGRRYPPFSRGRDNEELLKIIRKNIPDYIKEEGVKMAEAELLKNGITTAVSLVDNDVTFPEETIFLMERKSDMDFIIFPQTYALEEVKRLGLKRIGGCLLIDGSFGSKTAAISFNYKGTNSKGIIYPEEEFLYNFIKECYNNRMQTAFHAIGDRAIDFLLSIYEKIVDDENKLRMRIEHAELLTPSLIERIKKKNIILSMQPSFEKLWGGKNGMYADRLGDMANFTNPFSKLIKEGIMVAGGSDAPVTPPSPLMAIKALTEEIDEKKRVDFETAISIFTYNSAYGVMEENRKGVLREGYMADMVVLGKDMKIKEVYKEGKKVV